MERDILPAIGGKAIETLTAPEIVTLCRKIESRGVGETARRVFEDCNAIFSHGITMGACERNPCAEVKAGNFLKQTEKRNHARVSDAELPVVARALWSHPGIITRQAAKLTAYTALRTANVIGLEWEWVNLDAGEIRFPAEVMKTRTPFVCVLSAQAVEALRFMLQVSGNNRYVFPGHSAGKHLSNGAMLKALRDAGFGGKMTQHAWRAVFTTWAGDAGYSKDHVEAQLHHVRKGVRAHYDFATFIPQRRELMNAWSKHLDSLAALPRAIAAD
jgi:integrase